jgi:hypothetical protein
MNLQDQIKMGLQFLTAKGTDKLVDVAAGAIRKFSDRHNFQREDQIRELAQEVISALFNYATKGK